MIKRAGTITILNLKNLKAGYITMSILCGQLLIKILLAAFGVNLSRHIEINIGSFLCLLIPITAYIIITTNFKKMISLGLKRIDFLNGAFVTYIILCFILSFVSTLLNFTLDQFILNQNYFSGLLNITDFLGWGGRGIITIFIQQFIVLMLIATLFHTLFSISKLRYKWMIYVVLLLVTAALLFFPSSRTIVSEICNLIIFTENILTQFISSLTFILVLYFVNVIIYKSIEY